METIAQQISNLRLEIAAANWQLTIGVWVVTAIAMQAYLVATNTGNGKHYRVVMILLISGLFFTARQEYMIHRPAGYIRTIEVKQAKLVPLPTTTLPSWEFYKDGLASTRWFLPTVDFLAGLIWIYLFWASASALRVDDSSLHSSINDNFLLLSTAGFFAGMVAPFVATYVANK